MHVRLWIFLTVSFIAIVRNSTNQKLEEIQFFSYIKNMPDRAFRDFLFVAVISFVLLTLISFLKNIRDPEREEIENKALALDIARTKRFWYVKSVTIFGTSRIRTLGSAGWSELKLGLFENKKGGAVIEILSRDEDRKKIEIVISPRHPSFAILEDLLYLEAISFEFKEEPCDGSSGISPSTHLIIKRS